MQFPKSNLGIIEFEMKPDKNGNSYKHYCSIANWQEQTVIDSYDGKEKFWLDVGVPTKWQAVNPEDTQVHSIKESTHDAA